MKLETAIARLTSIRNKLGAGAELVITTDPLCHVEFDFKVINADPNGKGVIEIRLDMDGYEDAVAELKKPDSADNGKRVPEDDFDASLGSEDKDRIGAVHTLSGKPKPKDDMCSFCNELKTECSCADDEDDVPVDAPPKSDKDEDESEEPTCGRCHEPFSACDCDALPPEPITNGVRLVTQLVSLIDNNRDLHSCSSIKRIVHDDMQHVTSFSVISDYDEVIEREQEVCIKVEAITMYGSEFVKITHFNHSSGTRVITYPALVGVLPPGLGKLFDSVVSYMVLALEYNHAKADAYEVAL
jgi:hypothetical protein